MFGKCYKITGDNNTFIKIPGLFRTQYMFVGETKDKDLDIEGRFIKSCELYDTGDLIFQYYMEKEEEDEFLIFVIKCGNRQCPDVELALNEYGRKMAWAYPRYKRYTEELWESVIGDK